MFTTIAAVMAFSVVEPGIAPYQLQRVSTYQEGEGGSPGAKFDSNPKILDYTIIDCLEGTPWQALFTEIHSVKVEWELQTESQTRMEIWAVDDVLLTEWPLGEIIRSNPGMVPVVRNGTVDIDPFHTQPYHHSFYTGGVVVLQLECRYFSRAFGVIGVPWSPGTIKRFNFTPDDLD